MVKGCKNNRFVNKKLDSTIYYLKIGDYYSAIINIKEIMIEDLSFGKIHNLLEIYYEQQQDFNRARKHYRATYDLEPTLVAPRNNLERLGTFKYIFCDKYIDYGDGIS